MDRSHLGVVRDITLTLETSDGAPTHAVLTLFAIGDAHLETWYISGEKAVFADTFGISLEVQVVPTEGEGWSAGCGSLDARTPPVRFADASRPCQLLARTPSTI